jgi:sulfite exporter TauE/SafE
MELFTIFFTGLFTGGLTCLAVQGGLLASLLAQKRSEGEKNLFFPVLLFLAAKVVAYTILGLLLGAFGTVFQLSLTTRVVLQLFAGIFMLGTALNMLNIHPIFRYFIIQPPRFLMRLLKNQTKSKELFAPLTLGAMTVFIPCGTTQAMMVYAVSSTNPILGAMTMFAFTLGTAPLFILFGLLATKLGDIFQKYFYPIAASLVILLSIYTINSAIVLTGSPIHLGSILSVIQCTVSFCSDAKNVVAGNIELNGQLSNEITINFSDRGYNPREISVNRGEKITMHLVNDKGYGCIQAFTIPNLNIEEVVRVGDKKTLDFQAPQLPGKIAFMCSMGMYRGVINVI